MQAHRHNLRMLAAAALVLTGTALAGCFITAAPPPPATSGALQPLPKLDVKPICGTVKEYSAAEEKALADAVATLDEKSPIVAALGDYRRMREQARACKNFK